MTRLPFARLVLSDAKIVRERLENERDEREWRLDWALALVLLRTVGDVLDKVDGANDRLVKREARKLYQSWKVGEGNSIFRDFIKSERDSIVHEYRTSMTEEPVVVLATYTERDEVPEDLLSIMKENLYRPMGEGVFEGEDGRDLIDEALAWWSVQLDHIDDCLSN